jgi:hypothetical protein
VHFLSSLIELAIYRLFQVQQLVAHIDTSLSTDEAKKDHTLSKLFTACKPIFTGLGFLTLRGRPPVDKEMSCLQFVYHVNIFLSIVYKFVNMFTVLNQFGKTVQTV